MHELDTAFDLLTTTQQIIQNRRGLEVLHYLVTMAIMEAEDRRGDIRKSPRPLPP